MPKGCIDCDDGPCYMNCGPVARSLPDIPAPVKSKPKKKDAKMKEPMLQFFAYSHLKDEGMREVSRHFHDLANHMAEALPRNPERTVMLRKLLEAKDCAVRAFIYKE